MNPILRFAFVLLTASLLVGASSCGNDRKAANAPAATSSSKKASSKDLPNYRYVDLDTIISRYNLAKDYSEQMLRLQANFENEGRKHQNTIGGFAKNMEDKYKNNGYLSEASFNQDQQKLAAMQNSAQKTMASLENSMQKQYMEAQQIVNDSIQAYIDIYNAAHHYDAIFIKSATLYIDPALDITDEIVEGLNARYNKVKK